MTSKRRRDVEGHETGMREARKQEGGVRREVEQGAACESAVCASGQCATGNCVRNALIRLVVVAAALAAFAWVRQEMAWLLLAGLLVFTAAALWILDKWSLRRARATGRM